MVSDLEKIVELLRTGGPYVITALLGYAYWQKDRYIQQLHKEILDATIQNVNATQAMKLAIDSLKDTLREISSRL